MRTRQLEEWPRDHAYVQRLRALNRQPDASYETFKPGIEHADPEISANVIIGLIKLTTYLLDRQIAALENAFLEHGGMREIMTRARIKHRNGKGPSRTQGT